MRLRDDPDELEGAITIAAEQTGIPASQIRKDYWLTEILRACVAEVASHKGSHLVFKGGDESLQGLPTHPEIFRGRRRLAHRTRRQERG